MSKQFKHTGICRFSPLKRLAGSLLLIFCFSIQGYAQNNAAAEYQVKAIFLFNFTQFIDWPETAFKNADDPFIIGIIGNDPFGDYIDEAVAGEKIGTHPIRVKRLHEIKNAANCQMLYIHSSDRDYVRTVLASVEDKHILTVSDAPYFNSLGGIIRFYMEDNKIRLEINLTKSKAAQLNISSKLLNVAKTN